MVNTLRASFKQHQQFRQHIRGFFTDLGCVEVETPVLSSHLIPESAIEVFETTRFSLDGHSQSLYLLPSPELYMKQLLAEGVGNCFQLAKAFRNLEPTVADGSTKHLNEFCLLEWYLLDHTYRDNITVTQHFLQQLAPLAVPERRTLFETFHVVSMQQLFLQQLGIDLECCQQFVTFKEATCQAGYQYYADNSQSFRELFEFLFAGELEHRFSKGRSVFLTDYPAQIATTAKCSAGICERWELYMDNWEIANCYTEQTDQYLMQRLFEVEQQARKNNKVVHPVEYAYLNLFKTFPECSGVALGVDRLFARLAGLDCV